MASAAGFPPVYQDLITLASRSLVKSNPEVVLGQMREILQLFEAQGGKINASIDGVSGDTLLHRALKDRMIIIAEALIGQGARIDVRNYSDQTPETLASKEGRDVLDRIRKAANMFIARAPSAKPTDIATRFIEAIQSGNTDEVVRLAEETALDAVLCQKTGSKLGHLIVRYGPQQMLERLTHEGLVSLESLDNNGNSLISIAVQCSKHGMLRHLFFSYRIGDLAIDKRGYSPLHHAAALGDLEAVKILSWGNRRLPQNTPTPMHVAIEKRHASVVHFFLQYQKGFNDYPTREGLTILDLMVQTGQKGLVNLYLRHSDLTEMGMGRSLDKATALAERLGEREIAALLQSRRPDETEKFDFTRMRGLLLENKKEELKQYLQQQLSAGADIDALDEGGATCLYRAVEAGDLELTSILSEIAGASVNCLCRVNDVIDTEWSPLHLAARNGRDDLVLYLLHRGADRSIQSVPSQRKPINVAAEGIPTTLGNYRASAFGS